MHLSLISIVVFFLTLLFVHLLKPIAFKIDLVDHPNQVRKHHQGSIPLIGGIAIGLGFCIGILMLNVSLSAFRALLAAYVLLMVVGILDDFNEVSPLLRIGSQLLVGLLMACWGGVVLHQLGGSLGTLGLAAVPFTIVATMALINANNMLDGINGLAGGSSLITLACLYWVGMRSNANFDSQLLWVLISAIAAFLCFNFPILRYRQRLVFLGDAGSTSLGLVIAWFAVKFSQTPYTFLKPAYLAWLLILPIFDLISVTLRRVFIKRVSPLHGDREHIHYLLHSLGLRPSWVTVCLMLFALAGGLITIFMAEYHFSENAAYLLFIAFFLLYFFGTSLYWHSKKTLSHSIKETP